MKISNTDWTTHPRKYRITQKNTQTIASHFCDPPSQIKLFSLYQSEQFTLDYPIHRRNGFSLLLLNFTFRKTSAENRTFRAALLPQMPQTSQSKVLREIRTSNRTKTSCWTQPRHRSRHTSLTCSKENIFGNIHSHCISSRSYFFQKYQDTITRFCPTDSSNFTHPNYKDKLRTITVSFGDRWNSLPQ